MVGSKVLSSEDRRRCCSGQGCEHPRTGLATAVVADSVAVVGSTGDSILAAALCECRTALELLQADAYRTCRCRACHMYVCKCPKECHGGSDATDTATIVEACDMERGHGIT